MAFLSRNRPELAIAEVATLHLGAVGVVLYTASPRATIEHVLRDSEPIALTPEVMLRAYSVGIFPMAQSATDDRLVWFDPDPRGVLPLDRFHLSHRMARAVRTTDMRVTADTAFADVIDGCAGGGADRPSTWINGEIRALCLELHRTGFAHRDRKSVV